MNPDDNELVFLLWLITFMLMVIIFGFIMGSLIVASVVTNLDKAMLEQCEDEKREEQNEDFLSTVLNNADYDELDREDIKRDIREREIKMEYLTDFTIFATSRHKVEKQVLHKCANGKRTSERVEDKLLLLEALDNNLREYVTYRDQLIEVIEEIRVRNRLFENNLIIFNSIWTIQIRQTKTHYEFSNVQKFKTAHQL